MGNYHLPLTHRGAIMGRCLCRRYCDICTGWCDVVVLDERVVLSRGRTDDRAHKVILASGSETGVDVVTRLEGVIDGTNVGSWRMETCSEAQDERLCGCCMPGRPCIAVSGETR